MLVAGRFLQGLGAGGGLAYFNGATGTVADCEIIGNSTEESYNFGGGISCQSAIVSRILRCCRLYSWMRFT